MFSNIGIPGLILILVLALIIFGPKKVKQVVRIAKFSFFYTPFIL